MAPPLLTLDEICRVPNIFPAGSDMAKLHEFACSRNSTTQQEEMCAMPNTFEPGSLGDQLYSALCNPGSTATLPNLCEMAAQAPEGSSEMTMYTMLCQGVQGTDVAVAEIQSICQRNAMNLPAGSPEAATHYYACK